jgi:hypothetical protein
MNCAEIKTSPVVQDGDTRTLNDLDQVYGHAYDLAVARGRWMAYGLRTGHWLVASCSAELCRLIAADATVR